MAHGAVAVKGVAQVVECRGQAALHLARGSVDRKCGVAFQALCGYVAPGQHAWIDRAVGFVTGGAAFGSDWRMFKAERATLIGMALVAARFIGPIAGGRSHCFAVERSMRIMAIGAVQLPLQNFMGEGF